VEERVGEREGVRESGEKSERDLERRRKRRPRAGSIPGGELAGCFFWTVVKYFHHAFRDAIVGGDGGGGEGGIKSGV